MKASYLLNTNQTQLGYHSLLSLTRTRDTTLHIWVRGYPTFQKYKNQKVRAVDCALSWILHMAFHHRKTSLKVLPFIPPIQYQILPEPEDLSGFIVHSNWAHVADGENELTRWAHFLSLQRILTIIQPPRYLQFLPTYPRTACSITFMTYTHFCPSYNINDVHFARFTLLKTSSAEPSALPQYCSI